MADEIKAGPEFTVQRRKAAGRAEIVGEVQYEPWPADRTSPVAELRLDGVELADLVGRYFDGERVRIIIETVDLEGCPIK